MDFLERMLEHDYWATKSLLDVCAGLTDAQLDQEFDIGHRTLRETFSHMIFNLPFWAALMSGQTDYTGYSTDNLPEDRSITALARYHEQFHAEFASAARQVRDAGRLDETFTDEWDVRKSIGGTILMVLEHNVEHRPELLHILHRLGLSDLPEVDYGVWDYIINNT